MSTTTTREGARILYRDWDSGRGMGVDPFERRDVDDDLGVSSASDFSRSKGAKSMKQDSQTLAKEVRIARFFVGVVLGVLMGSIWIIGNAIADEASSAQAPQSIRTALSD